MELLDRANKQKKLAAGLLVGGIMSVGAAIPVGVTSFYSSKKDNYTVFKLLFYGGLGAIGASIPLFVTASSTRQKANDIAIGFKLDSRFALSHGSQITKPYPALRFQIKL